MSKLTFSPIAEADLNEIWDYIADDNVIAATKFTAKIKEKCKFLSQSPNVGRLRKNIAPLIRSFPTGNYVIYYRSVESGIEVVRVLHAARRIKNLF